MSKLNCGPITPYNVISDPRYLQELEIRKPKSRIRIEDKWIKDIHEKGTVGILFELQGLETKLQELKLLERERSKMSSVTTIPWCRSGRHKMPSDYHRQTKYEQFESEKKSDVANEAETGNNTHEEADDQPNQFNANSNDQKQQLVSQNRVYLKAHENSGPPLDVDQYPPIQKIDLKNPEKIRVSVATGKSAASVKFQRRHIDYIRANAYALQTDRYKENSKFSTSTPQLDMRNYKKGELPKYLKVIKKKSNSNGKTSDNLVDTKERLLTGLEKQKILEKLKSDLQNVYGELNSMPISMETVRSRSRKDQLEKQIDEIIKRIDIFNRQNVYMTV